MRRLLGIQALVVLLASGLAGCSDPPERFFITDDQGRALILHGANVSDSAKGDPGRLPWVEPEDVTRLSRDWGFNFARYLILWDALEPAPWEFDLAYLERVEQRLDWFHDAGIHVVIDMHQDVYSRVFCCDGAPLWAVRDDGLPFLLQPLWSLNYFQPAVIRAFDNFFDYAGPHRDLQDHYMEAWARVAERFRDHPAVLGYDLMNEPFPGSYMSRLEALGGEDPDNQGPVFDETLLRPFYERVIARIREVDPDRWIFYEPHLAGPANGFRSHVEPVADAREGEPRLVSSPHFYTFGVEIVGRYDPDDPAFPRWRASRREEMAIQRAPVVVGEWGTTDSVPNRIAFFERFLRLADEETSGWALWDYSKGGGYALLDAQGNEKAHVDTLVRAYPQRVAGHPVHYGYEPATRVMTLSFREKAGVTGPTEIYVPAARHYPDGFEVVVSDPAGSWRQEWEPGREMLFLWTDPAQPRHAVCVAPKASDCPSR